MENDNVTVENTNVESTGEIQFVDSVEELQQSMQGDTPAQPQEPVQEEGQQVTQEQPIQEEKERVTSISDNTEYQNAYTDFLKKNMIYEEEPKEEKSKPKKRVKKEPKKLEYFMA